MYFIQNINKIHFPYILYKKVTYTYMPPVKSYFTSTVVPSGPGVSCKYVLIASLAFSIISSLFSSNKSSTLAWYVGSSF